MDKCLIHVNPAGKFVFNCCWMFPQRKNMNQMQLQLAPYAVCIGFVTPLLILNCKIVVRLLCLRQNHSLLPPLSPSTFHLLLFSDPPVFSKIMKAEDNEKFPGIAYTKRERELKIIIMILMEILSLLSLQYAEM